MLTYYKFSNPFTVLLLIVAAFVIFRRRLYRELPWFTAYIFYVMVYTLTTYAVSVVAPRSKVAFYNYWLGNIISLLVACMVIIEIFRNCVRGHQSIRNIGVKLLLVIALVSITVAIMMFPYGSQFEQKTQLAGLARSLIVLQRSIRLVQVGLLIAIFAFSTYLGLSWRNHNFGIALGYGLYASVNLVTSVVAEYLAARKAFPAVGYANLIDGLAYKLTIILWITYLVRSDHSESNQPLPPSGGDDLDHWDDALKPLAK